MSQCFRIFGVMPADPLSDGFCAYVMHSRPFRESSAIVEVFSKEHGVLHLVARGARRVQKTSSWYALLQPFVPLWMAFREREDLGTLHRAEPRKAAFFLRGEALFYGLYLNELLIRTLKKRDPYPKLFEAYESLLGQLMGAVPKAREHYLRSFERCLLSELGFGLRWDVEAVSGEPLEDDVIYHYVLHEGLKPLAEGLHGPLCAPGVVWKAFAREDYEQEAVVRLARKTHRVLLKQYLAFEHPNSRSLWLRGRGASEASGSPGTLRPEFALDPG